MPGTLRAEAAGNPTAGDLPKQQSCKKGQVKKHGKCVAKKHHKKKKQHHKKKGGRR